MHGRVLGLGGGNPVPGGASLRLPVLCSAAGCGAACGVAVLRSCRAAQCALSGVGPIQCMVNTAGRREKKISKLRKRKESSKKRVFFRKRLWLAAQHFTSHRDTSHRSTAQHSTAINRTYRILVTSNTGGVYYPVCQFCLAPTQPASPTSACVCAPLTCRARRNGSGLAMAKFGAQSGYE